MCKVYGYARISKATQDINRQIRNIKEYDGTAVIYQEAYTGTKSDRPKWNRLLSTVKADDTIIFDSVSRMSRNADDGIRQYFELYNKGVNLIFLNEPQINTDVYKSSLHQSIEKTGNDIADIYITATNEVLKLIAEKQIRIAFEQAEKEVADLHKRTSQGLQTAKLNGKRVGRQKGETFTTKKSEAAKKIMLKHCIDFGGTLTDVEVLQMIGNISRNSYYKYKRELKS